MEELKTNELLEIVGGFSITGTLINSVISAGKFLYSIGQGFGSSLRRIGGNGLCPLR